MRISDQFPKGAEWRKWDLHIHTPNSIVHHFAGSDPEAKWEQFITDLENLPPEFKVIGINDYLFIDGYRKVLEYRNAGRLKNINTILPVVEFRIKKFAGHKDFKRVNFHVIFSDELSPDIIQSQFLNGLNGKYTLTPGLTGVQWSGLITPESLSDLGRAIRSSVSAEQLLKYGSELEEGFNNLNVDEGAMLTLLKDSSYLKNHFLTAVGKTEWESLSWNDQSIAEKKDIINKVDFVFISSATAEACDNAKAKLKEQLVNHLLLDCSDAHYNTSEATQKDRIGKCFTWIKGDPTFEGLKQIKFESATRILIQDDTPDEKTPYQVIDKVKFVGADTANYFNSKAIELNPNLNVIIGGKSSGKSLLLYHIAKTIDPVQVAERLDVVNEPAYDLSSVSSGFDFAVRWKDGKIDKLSDDSSLRNRQITYIPQMYINHLAEQKGEGKLAELIESILYQNLEFKGFSDKSRVAIQELNLKIGNDVNELFGISANYQNKAKELKAIGDKKAITENIEKLKKEIADLNLKAGFTSKETTPYNKLQQRKERIEADKFRVENYLTRVYDYSTELSNLKDELSNRLGSASQYWYEIHGTTAEKFVENNITSDIKSIHTAMDLIIAKYAGIDESLNTAIETKAANLAAVAISITPFIAKVSNQQLLRRLQNDVNADELKIKQIEDKEHQLSQIQESGRKLKAEVLTCIGSLFDQYKLLLARIQQPDLSKIGPGLKLITKLEIDSHSFQNGFCGLLDGRSNFNTLFGDCFDSGNNYVYSETTHFDNIKSIFDKVWSAAQHQIKFRSGYGAQEAVQQLFKDNYKFKYNISYNGDDILKMSPGKRGLVLLQIILHLSNAKHPILIDQPEDNLDNRTIFKDLNDFIKDKKTQRQIILVTHNANLVVSTDAEEIIVANQDGQDAGKKNERFQFEYVSGSLENTFKNITNEGILNQMGIREHVCDILEGGEAAFVYRERKYGFRD